MFYCFSQCTVALGIRSIFRTMVGCAAGGTCGTGLFTSIISQERVLEALEFVALEFQIEHCFLP